MKDIIIIKTGDSFPALAARRGDFEDWILEGMGRQDSLRASIIPVHKRGILPDTDSTGGIIITGSHAMVTDQSDWILATTDWLKKAVKQEIPLLGICFGHQILAHALGGIVDWMPVGPEFGTVPLRLSSDVADDPLFSNLPQPVEVHTSHHQSVTELPPMSVLLASSEKDPHSAFRYGRCAWGVQFHPEYDADIANSYIKEFNKETSKSRADAPDLPCNCRDTITGEIILSRFYAFALNR